MIEPVLLKLLTAQVHQEEALAPFNGTLLIIAGAAMVVGAFIAIDRFQQHRMDERIKTKKLEAAESEAAKHKEMVTEVVAAAFTGRAEADHHFRAEALSNYKTVLREALDDHAKDERRYIDGLRDKIVEYHATSLQAIQDAKRIAMHVSTEYQIIQKRLLEMEKELENIRADLKELATHTHDQGSV
jgi:hypothetical protein